MSLITGDLGARNTVRVGAHSMTRQKSAPRRGAATVELAVLLPFLLFLSVIATDWARLMYYTITVESCARNGAIHASDQVMAAKSAHPTAAAAAVAEFPSLVAGATAATTTGTGTGPNGNYTYTTTTYTSPAGATVATVEVRTGVKNPNTDPAALVTVSVPFTTLTNFPGVPKSETLTRSVQMRIAPMSTN